MKFPPHDEANHALFTGPQQRERALHTLRGILAGFAMDEVVNVLEHEELIRWLETYSYLDRKDGALAEMVRVVRRAVADGILTVEEIEDITALCERMDPQSPYFNVLTNRLQELQGILHGLVADILINEVELRRLQGWLERAEDYAAYWPVSEVESVIVGVLKDGRIDEREQRFLLKFFGQFAEVSAVTRTAIEALPEEELVLEGICATAPAIEFEERSFCFTGFSEKASREEMAQRIIDRRGAHLERVRTDLSYLVVCEGGSSCWAFSCYGRKVERAMKFRKAGHPIVIVHERDFWDALR